MAEPRADTPAHSSAALAKYFDRIFVISLPRATDRHAALESALAGLPYEIVWGVDKQELRLEELERAGIYDDRRARALHRHGRGMNVGQIACALSHVAIWRRMVDEGIRRALIFEDDAEPIEGAIELVPAAIEQLPEDWELLYLGYDRNEQATPWRRIKQATYVALGAAGLIRWSSREAMNLLPRPFSTNLRRAGFHDFLHAYGITSSAAAKLVSFQTPVVLNADTAVTRLILRSRISGYVTEPKIYRQRPGHSYIEGTWANKSRAGEGS